MEEIVSGGGKNSDYQYDLLITQNWPALRTSNSCRPVIRSAMFCLLINGAAIISRFIIPTPRRCVQGKQRADRFSEIAILVSFARTGGMRRNIVVRETAQGVRRGDGFISIRDIPEISSAAIR